jgi:pimeloyl-ACP methyl ester carboxylesterase
MWPLFAHYRSQRPVYALDLPGYGVSARSDRTYSPELFTEAVLALLQRLDEPADVVALSLSSEFAARAARRAPDRVRSLTLISPTGFSSSTGSDGGDTSSGFGDTVHSVLAFPLWARPLFDLLTTRASIKYYLQKSFVGAVPEDMIDYAYATAHQPGAEHAPLYFLSGKLFTPRVRTAIYDDVTQPTLVLYDQDPYVGFGALSPFVAVHENWQAQRVTPTLGLPHFERLEATTELLDRFWG